MFLDPQQESEQVQRRENCTKRGSPPTRETVVDFAGATAKDWQAYETHPKQDYAVFFEWCIGVTENREDIAKVHFRRA